jgi:SAM-dependent methyltransferase
MTDLNSLEKFNQHYKTFAKRDYEKSLNDFFTTQVQFRLPKDPVVLELGPGSKSVFEDSDLNHKLITAVDFSPEAIDLNRGHSSINYQLRDITKNHAIEENTYDLIFDSHCLHCIERVEDRAMSFKNIYHGLKSDGLFCAEMMVQPLGSVINLPHKYIANSRNLEQELISYGFTIKYFMIVRELVFESGNGVCDLLRVICKK